MPDMTVKKLRPPVQQMTYTVHEAAIILGLGRQLTYVLIRTGEIPAIRLGYRWLVPRKTMDRLLETNYTPPEKTSGIV